MTRNQRKLHPILWMIVAILGGLAIVGGIPLRSPHTPATQAGPESDGAGVTP